MKDYDALTEVHISGNRHLNTADILSENFPYSSWPRREHARDDLPTSVNNGMSQRRSGGIAEPTDTKRRMPSAARLNASPAPPVAHSRPETHTRRRDEHAESDVIPLPTLHPLAIRMGTSRLWDWAPVSRRRQLDAFDVGGKFRLRQRARMDFHLVDDAGRTVRFAGGCARQGTHSRPRSAAGWSLHLGDIHCPDGR